MGAVFSIIFFLFFSFAVGEAAAAETFTVTLPAGSEVVMLEPTEILPFTITNQSASKEIREIVFTFDATRNTLVTPQSLPLGWCVKTFSTTQITYSLEQGGGGCSSGANGSQIPPGGSLVFNIYLSPLQGASDVTDTLLNVAVNSQGGFTRSGGLPTWSRRALSATLTPSPLAIGLGGEITLQMLVSNRSSATQSTITTSPSPPSPTSAIVTSTGGPYTALTDLLSDVTSTASTIPVGSTAQFASSGTARLDSEDICYTGKTATELTGATRGCNSTTAAAHYAGAQVWSLSGFSLAPGEYRVITWKYSAAAVGETYFTARAVNGALTASSNNARSSSVVIIKDFTALLAVTPTSVTSGQTVTVTMTVRNNTEAALINIIPSALTPCPGGATETLLSGPTPSSITSLAAASTGTFTWTYSVTGSTLQTYCFSGSATADGPIVTNTPVSNSGSIASYSIVVSPPSIASGAVNKTVSWTVYNNGACPLKQVSVQTPASGGNWTCSSVTPPSGWSGGCSGTVQFQSHNSPSDIPIGGFKTFSVTFSTTRTVTAEEDVLVPVSVIPRGCGELSSTLATFIKVTPFVLTLSHSPAGPIEADGSSRYTMTATLTSGGVPLTGQIITFSATAGSFYPTNTATTVSPGGTATIYFVAPNSTVDASATVTAAYLNVSATDTVSFRGVTGPNLQYFGGLSPLTVNCGNRYSFSMNVKNIGTASVSLSTGSYFAFNEPSTSAVFQAFLTAPATLSPGSTANLTFAYPGASGACVLVSSAFLAKQYTPLSNAAPPPQSGLFFTDGAAFNQYRTVTDKVTVQGSCGRRRINVIDWHEMR